MTSKVEVLGRDPGREAYRIRTAVDGRDLVSWVPECLVDTSLRPGDRPSHQEAYEWIAANRAALWRATRDLAAGQSPRRPFDIVTLAKEADHAR